MARLELGVDITVEGARELQKVSGALSGTSDELDELAEHLDDAADSARKMADDIDDAAGSLNFDKASNGAQTLEDAGEGVRNTVNGLTDVFAAAGDESLTFGERLALGAGGIGSSQRDHSGPGRDQGCADRDHDRECYRVRGADSRVDIIGRGGNRRRRGNRGGMGGGPGPGGSTRRGRYRGGGSHHSQLGQGSRVL